jgi:hypothetical protein
MQQDLLHNRLTTVPSTYKRQTIHDVFASYTQYVFQYNWYDNISQHKHVYTVITVFTRTLDIFSQFDV